MQCEDVQKELALAGSTTETRKLIQAHLDSCVRCRASATFYDRLNQALLEPAWQPPPGFAIRVAELAEPFPQELPGTLAVASMLRPFAAILGAAGLIILLAGTIGSMSFLSGTAVALDTLAVHAASLAWIFATVFLFITIWLTRRVLAE